MWRCNVCLGAALCPSRFVKLWSSVQPGLRLSAASGHKFSLVGCFRIEVRVIGRSFERRFYVMACLSKCKGVFGINFIGETQLCISVDHLFFQKLPLMDNVECSVLTATEALTVPPLSVIRVPVKVKSARGKKIVAGTYEICSTAYDKLGVWGSLNRVNHDVVIFSVLTNISNHEQFYKTGVKDYNAVVSGVPGGVRSLDPVNRHFPMEGVQSRG